ncbi:MAG: hypothetical protein L0216_21655 [Planctomycetales bacterium]|nr:hypothetical protein [Planctomycetales bacterium]
MRMLVAVGTVLAVSGLGAAQDPNGGGQAPATPAENPAAQGGPLAIGRRIFAALNDARASSKVPAALWSDKVYIALQDHVNALVRAGYRGQGPPGKSLPKSKPLALSRHGWALNLFENFTNGDKSSMSPAQIVSLLRQHPQIRSLMRTDLNCGAAAACECPGATYLIINVALAREPNSFVTVRGKVDAALGALENADGAKRLAVAKTLAGLKDPETLLGLTDLLSASEADVRKEAARGLAGLEDCWPMDKLVERIASEPDAGAKAEVQRALEAISGKRDYKDDATKWKIWWDVERDVFVKRK